MQLGPEPMIGAQAVELIDARQQADPQAAKVRIATDGLRPFSLQPLQPVQLVQPIQPVGPS